ncbi:MAG: hypothetical protein QOE87_995 [Gaiellales bacterium]|jgi:hypothetical protein|nr:hypothetical protein [Gaiellales bacterium]
MGDMRGMTESPHETPPVGPDDPGGPGTPITTPPPVTRRDQDRTGQVGQKDSDAGPNGPFPDPDEYADPHDRAGS